MRKSEEGRGGRGEEDEGRSDPDLLKKPGSVTGSGGGTNGNGVLRRYLVLLQDCIAIKFVSISQLEQKKQNFRSGGNSPPHQCSLSPVSKCQCRDVNYGDGQSGAGDSDRNNRKQSEYEVIGGGRECYSRCSSGLGESEKGNSIRSNNMCGGGSACGKFHFQDVAPFLPNREKMSMMAKVDHSMEALFLYKEFREINLHCFWNTAVTEAFTHLEYKGSLLPSTIIVGSPIRKYLTILKTAWSRKMLRSPQGYLIDFLGEIEELIADPIAKSHFVPLSDSLCWAIHELTSSGEEAFVDDICLRLASAYPGMALPTKELIYQTLEKLTRERKIYQTAQGYFVVTPDTHRYISSTEPWLMIQSNSQNSPSSHYLSPSPPHPVEETLGKADKKGEDDAEYQNAYQSRNAPSPDSSIYSLPYGTFKRYNSLRIKKNGGTNTTTGCLSRTLSMRLPKSKSKQVVPSSSSGGGGSDETRPSDVVGSFQPPSVSEQLLTRRRKHKSFLSRLLSFRGARKSNRKDKVGRPISVTSNKVQTIVIPKSEKVPKKVVISNDTDGGGDDDEDNDSGTGDAKDDSKRDSNMTTASTQTNISIENLNEDLSLLGLNPNGQHRSDKGSTLEREQDADSGRCSDADAEITAALSRGRFTPTSSPGGRRLGDSTANNNAYDKQLGLKVDVGECEGRSPRSPCQSHISISPSPSTFTNTSATASGRMGGVNSRNNNRCHSSASSSGYSYRDFYNLYRRRHYPSYYHQHQQPSSTPTPTSSTSPEMTYPVEISELHDVRLIKPNIRYPPRSFERKQIFDEVTGRSSFREKKRNGHKSVSISLGESSPGKFSPRAGRCDLGGGKSTPSNDIHSTTTTTSSILHSPNDPNSSTTTFTQTLKNSTNLELEFHLPLGNLISAAMNNSENDKKEPSSEQSPPTPKDSKSPLPPTPPPRTISTTPTLNEINTMVNELFTIKSFVKSNPFSDGELSSTFEFRTRGSNGGNNDLESSGINVNHGTGPKDLRHQHHQRYKIETVSSKPFTSNVHTKFYRESEII